MLGRLTTVIDTGTMNGERRVLLGFQLSEIIVKPQDETLPDYCAFAKTEYGGLINIESPFINDVLGIVHDLEGDDLVQEVVRCAGKIYEIDYEEREYQGKPQYVVKSVAISPEILNIEWGVEPKTFILSDDTTLEEVKDLGFDSKHVKNSDEYNIIKNKILDSDDVPF